MLLTVAHWFVGQLRGWPHAFEQKLAADRHRSSHLRYPRFFPHNPILRVMHAYGLSDSLWAVIAAQVIFATPFAVLILQQYAKLVPIEFDEAARVDGASPCRCICAFISH